MQKLHRKLKHKTHLISNLWIRLWQILHVHAIHPANRGHYKHPSKTIEKLTAASLHITLKHKWNIKNQSRQSKFKSPRSLNGCLHIPLRHLWQLSPVYLFFYKQMHITQKMTNSLMKLARAAYINNYHVKFSLLQGHYTIKPHYLSPHFACID